MATMVPWEEPFPTDIRRVKNRWLDVFADGVSDAELGRHVLSDGNYLWHLFSWNLVPCLSADKGSCMHYDPSLPASVFLQNDLEMLLRMRNVLQS